MLFNWFIIIKKHAQLQNNNNLQHLHKIWYYCLISVHRSKWISLFDLNEGSSPFKRLNLVCSNDQILNVRHFSIDTFNSSFEMVHVLLMFASFVLLFFHLFIFIYYDFFLFDKQYKNSIQWSCCCFFCDLRYFTISLKLLFVAYVIGGIDTTFLLWFSLKMDKSFASTKWNCWLCNVSLLYFFVLFTTKCDVMFFNEPNKQRKSFQTEGNEKRYFLFCVNVFSFFPLQMIMMYQWHRKNVHQKRSFAAICRHSMWIRCGLDEFWAEHFR